MKTDCPECEGIRISLKYVRGRYTRNRTDMEYKIAAECTIIIDHLESLLVKCPECKGAGTVEEEDDE